MKSFIKLKAPPIPDGAALFYKLFPNSPCNFSRYRLKLQLETYMRQAARCW